MKKILLVLCAVMMMVLLTGCITPSVRTAVVSKLPDKLVYIAGQDTELDLRGGEITLITNPVLFFPEEVREGQLMIWHSDGFNYNIDFNTPGIYVVMFNFGTDEVEASFEIQVVTQEEYDAMQGPAE